MENVTYIKLTGVDDLEDLIEDHQAELFKDHADSGGKCDHISGVICQDFDEATFLEWLHNKGYTASSSFIREYLAFCLDEWEEYQEEQA